jgi:hypothetical protein
MDEKRLTVKFEVTDAEGNITAGMTLGMMKLEDVKALEAVLLEALKSQLA